MTAGNDYLDLEALCKENAKLRRALKPFADMLTAWENDGDTPPIGRSKTIEMNVRVSDLRRARAMVKDEQNGGGDGR